MCKKKRVRGEVARQSGDTTSCRMTGVTLHGVISLEPGQRGCCL